MIVPGAHRKAHNPKWSTFTLGQTERMMNRTQPLAPELEQLLAVHTKLSFELISWQANEEEVTAELNKTVVYDQVGHVWQILPDGHFTRNGSLTDPAKFHSPV
jgi:hypothetical protein